MSDFHPCDLFEPDLDDLTRAELWEHDERAAITAEVLDDWLHTQHGVISGAHCVGSFLELLADRGYRVTAIDPGPPLEELLPAAVD